MSTEKALLIGAGALGVYYLWQTSRSVNRLANDAAPVLRSANQIAGNVAGITGSFAGLSNAAVAAGQGLRSLFGFSSSGPNAPSQPATGLNSFQTSNGWNAVGGGSGQPGWTSAQAPGLLSGGSWTDGGIFGGGFFQNAQEDAA